MRGLFRLIGLLIAAAIVAALAIFATQNAASMSGQFLGMSFTGNVWWICVGSAILGFLLAFLLLAPGRVAAGWRGRTLGRERARLQDELAVVRAREAHLRAEHEQLQAQHDQITAERDQLRQTTASAVSAAPTAPAAVAPDGAALTRAPLVPPAQPVGTTASIAQSADHPPTLGERLRGAFYRPSQPQPEAADTTQGPPVPTA